MACLSRGRAGRGGCTPERWEEVISHEEMGPAMRRRGVSLTDKINSVHPPRPAALPMPGGPGAGSLAPSPPLHPSLLATCSLKSARPHFSLSADRPPGLTHLFLNSRLSLLVLVPKTAQYLSASIPIFQERDPDGSRSPGLIS